jgi:hypothetical protein
LACFVNWGGIFWVSSRFTLPSEQDTAAWDEYKRLSAGLSSVRPSATAEVIAPNDPNKVQNFVNRLRLFRFLFRDLR